MTSPAQDYSAKVIRDAAILTNSYVAATVIGGSGLSAENTNQLILNIENTLGSLTSIEIKVEFSHDGITYYQDTFLAISGGTATASLGEYTFAADGNYRLAIPVKDAFVKVSAKGTGTVTSSSCKITRVIGIA